MTLNGSFFPALPMPSTTLELCRTAFGPDGGQRAEEGMRPYVDLLDAHLISDQRWRDARRLVVGHSFGGMLAMAWYLSHRGRGVAAIDGLVLASTTAGPMYDCVQLLLGRIGTADVRVPAAPLLPVWNHPSITRLAKRLLGGGLEVTPVDFQVIHPPTDFRLDLAGWHNTDWRAMRSYRFAMKGFDVRTRLHEIHVPTIVLHGTADSLFALRTAEMLAAGLPHAELRVVEGAGHGLPLTHGGEVVRAVRDLADL